MLNEEKYLAALSAIADTHVNHEDVAITLVTDPHILKDFEKEQDLPIGMIDNQPYYDFFMNVYYNKHTKQYFRYCSIEYSRQGAAVLVVLQKENERIFLLNRQYRAILDAVVYETPRGFSDPSDTDALCTAIRELAEETGLDLSNTACKLTELGSVHPDSGLSNNSVMLFVVEIPIEECVNFVVQNENESIVGHSIVTEREFLEMISNGQISDSFTLAAYTRYKFRKE